MDQSLPIISSEFTECAFRRPIEIWNKDGRRKTQQCGHPEAPQCTQEVTVDTCHACPLRALFPVAVPKEKAPEPQKRSRGFGDTISKVTSAFGIKPCDGCKQRQAFLNKWLPYRVRTVQT